VPSPTFTAALALTPAALPTPMVVASATPYVPIVTQILAQGDELPFDVCGESTTWVRPPEEEQNAKWWANFRYRGTDEQVLKYPWAHDFFVNYGHTSVTYDIENLSGLWTLPANVRTPCFEPARHDAILKLQTAEIWVLLHRVKSVKRLGTFYVVVVEPTREGVQFVQFPRPESWLPLTLCFVTEDGREVDRIVEADYLYWPYPQLIPTPTTAGNGQ
jgi:hypothetical protein